MVNPELSRRPELVRAKRKQPKPEPYPGYFEGMLKDVSSRKVAEPANEKPDLATKLAAKENREKLIRQKVILEAELKRRLTESEREVLLSHPSSIDYDSRLAEAVNEARQLDKESSELGAKKVFDAANYTPETEPGSREWNLDKDQGRAALDYVLQFSDLDEESFAEFAARLDPQTLKASDFKRLLPKEKISDFQKPAADAFEARLDQAVEDFKDGSMTPAERGAWHREILLTDIKNASVLVLPSKRDFKMEFNQSLGSEGAPFTAENAELFCDTKEVLNRAEYNELVKIAKSYNSDIHLPAYEEAVQMSPLALEAVVQKNFGIHTKTDSTRDPWQDTEPGFFGAGVKKPERLLFELADRYQMLAVVGGVIKETRQELLESAEAVKPKIAGQKQQVA